MYLGDCEDLSLVYGGSVLKNCKSSVHDNSIEDGSELHVVVKKVPREPKRPPPSAYFIFVQEKRPTVNPSNLLPLGETARRLTQMWNLLDTEEKKQYQDQAAELKAQYEAEMVEYRAYVESLNMRPRKRLKT